MVPARDDQGGRYYGLEIIKAARGRRHFTVSTLGSAVVSGGLRNHRCCHRHTGVMVGVKSVSSTLQQRIDRYVHHKPAEASSRRHSKLQPTLSLPPAAALSTQQFLPHNLPKMKTSTTAFTSSWESPTLQALSASSLHPRPLVSDLLAMPTRAQKRLSPNLPSVPPDVYEGGGAVPSLLRPASKASLRPVKSAGSLRPVKSADLLTSSLTAASLITTSSRQQLLRPHSRHRLLPQGVHPEQLSSALPSLAYSTYRPLDIWRT